MAISRMGIRLRKRPTGNSDHDTVFLLPSNRQKLKSEKPKQKLVKVCQRERFLTVPAGMRSRALT